jgi:serine/threonine protein kinase
MAFDILTALKELHSLGIIHSDIKPQNFLLFGNTGHSDDSFDDNIILKLADFGLCHYIDSRTGKAAMKLACGTHGYKAPEVQNVRYNI